MNNKLLKKLRKEAKRNVFLVPISGDINRCVVEVDEFDPNFYYYGGRWISRYYFKEGIEEAYQERSIPESLRLKNKKLSRQPYNFAEACVLMDKLRRDYVIKKAEEMRLTWKKHQEKFRTWTLRLII